MKIKTSDLIGAALDWTVATIEGYGGLRRNPHAFNQDLIMNRKDGQCVLFSTLKFSEGWGIGGPLIEREQIEVRRGNDLYFPKGNEKGDFYEQVWLASIGASRKFHGQTPLIAAMRCYCYDKFGDEIEIPEELS